MLYLEVSGGENEQAALDYLNHYRSPHMLGIDADYAMMHAYQALGWPRHVIIDREGVVRFHGFAADESLGNIRDCLDGLLSKSAPKRFASLNTPLKVATDANSSRLSVRDRIAYPTDILAARDARRERSPRLALDPQGRPWVVYFANPAGQNEIFLRPPATEGTPSDIAMTNDPADDYAPDAAFDSSGKLWVVWCGNRSGRYDVYLRQWGGTAPQSVIRLTSSTEDAMRPRLAAGPAGRLAVAYYKWHSLGGVSRDRDVYARLFEPGRGWGPELAVSPPEPAVEDHTDPDVAFGPDGKPMVVWSYDYHPSLFKKPLDTDQPSIFGALLGPQGAGTAQLAGTVGARLGCIDLFPSVARDGAGTLWCAWDASRMNGERTMRLARWTGESFTSEGDLGSGEIASTPELSPGQGKALLAAWTEQRGRDKGWAGCFAVLEDGRTVRQTRVMAPAGLGSPPDIRFPQAAQGSDGKIWAAWEECGEKGSRVVLKDLTTSLK